MDFAQYHGLHLLNTIQRLVYGLYCHPNLNLWEQSLVQLHWLVHGIIAGTVETCVINLRISTSG